MGSQRESAVWTTVRLSTAGCGAITINDTQNTDVRVPTCDRWL